jgi:hypothetical protein
MLAFACNGSLKIIGVTGAAAHRKDSLAFRQTGLTGSGTLQFSALVTGLVFEGRMLPGATVSADDHRVLSSPARVAVILYLKGHGRRIVRVQTGVTATSKGVTENSEGILPMAGERWRICTDRSRQALPTSDCNGTRQLR